MRDRVWATRSRTSAGSDRAGSERVVADPDRPVRPICRYYLFAVGLARPAPARASHRLGNRADLLRSCRIFGGALEVSRARAPARWLDQREVLTVICWRQRRSAPGAIGARVRWSPDPESRATGDGSRGGWSDRLRRVVILAAAGRRAYRRLLGGRPRNRRCPPVSPRPVSAPRADL